MDNLEELGIRFHFGGEFVQQNGHLSYVGGRTVLCHVEVDKVSFFEIKGHLDEHVSTTSVMRLHWLKPGFELQDGLVLLLDDTSCKVMADHITDGGVAEIYVEKVVVDVVGSGDDEDIWEGNGKAESGHVIDDGGKLPCRKMEDRDYKSFMEFYRSPSKSILPCCHAISCIYKASKTLDDYIAPCFTKTEYLKTYEHVLQPVEGPGNWPIADMPRPLPPAFVKKPGRPKTERRREQGEEPKGTKLNRVGIKMSCRLCGKSDHNARRCPKNPEAGSKQNAHIKRDRSRKRKNAEPCTSAATQVRENTSTKRTRHAPMSAVGTSGSQPTQSQPSGVATQPAPPTSRQPWRGGNTRSQPTQVQASRLATQLTPSTSRQPRQRGIRSHRLANLLFGDSY